MQADQDPPRDSIKDLTGPHAQLRTRMIMKHELHYRMRSLNALANIKSECTSVREGYGTSWKLLSVLIIVYRSILCILLCRYKWTIHPLKRRNSY